MVEACFNLFSCRNEQDLDRVADLLADVQDTAGISRVSGMRAEEESEI